MTDEFKAELDRYSLDYQEADHVADAIAEADVILVEPVVQPDYTKSRDEREGDVDLTPENYKITRELLTSKAKVGCHPAALAAENGRDSRRRGYHPLVPLLAGVVQRRGDEDGAVGVGPRGDGVRRPKSSPGLPSPAQRSSARRGMWG